MTDATTRLQKARDEINLAENAAIRLENAHKRGDTAKVGVEAPIVRKALSRALYATDAALKGNAPTPAPQPTPTPPPVSPPPDPQPEPAPQPQPEPPPPHQTPAPKPSGWLRTADVPVIPPSFDTAQFITTREPAPSAGEDQAALRIDQPATAISFIDPFFREMSDHSHDLFNRSATPISGEYADLVRTNNSIGEGRLINGSWYAISSLLVQDMDGRWHVLIARYSIVYYKQAHPGHSDWARDAAKGIIRADLPRGLKALGGIRHYRDPNQWRFGNDPVGHAPCNYMVNRPDGSELKTWKLDDILPFLKLGGRIQVNIDFPTYWDGTHSDSPDHRAHLLHRPTATHIYSIPHVTMHAAYDLPMFPIQRIVCSADLRADGTLKGVPGEETHGYFWEGWVDEFLQRMHRTNFDRNLSTSNGGFGDGTTLIGRDRRLDPKPVSVPYDVVRAAPDGEFNLIGLK